MPVQAEDSEERLLELLVGERVTEGVHRTVEIAQPVGDVVQDGFDATRTEPDDHRQDVPRSPTETEATYRRRKDTIKKTVVLLVCDAICNNITRVTRRRMPYKWRQIFRRSLVIISTLENEKVAQTPGA